MGPPLDQLIAQKFDLQFDTNALAHLLFIRLFYPLLVSIAAPDSPSRVVWVASAAQHLFKPPIKCDWIADTEKRRKQDPWNLYVQSDKDNVVFSLDPGNAKADLLRVPITRVMLSPVELGARPDPTLCRYRTLPSDR